jgi:NTE family protein
MSRLQHILESLREGISPVSRRIARLEREDSHTSPVCALVLSGGGARAAYQAGVLRFIADTFPDAAFPILTGVSAGSINAAALANRESSFSSATSKLVYCWSNIEASDVFSTPSSIGYLWRALKGGPDEHGGEFMPRHGIVDTAPLREYLCRILNAPNGILEGIDVNLAGGVLSAIALISTNYATGQTVSWLQGGDFDTWERPNRVGVRANLTVDHIMGSTALPFLFPAIQLGQDWYGDGGIRLSEPLSPAIHLGANRIIAVSTRYGRTRKEADMPLIRGYPPAAQIFGILLNAVFLDRIDQDAAVLERYNRLLAKIPKREREGMQQIKMVLIRPSRDLGKLSGEYQADLSGILKLFARGLGSSDTKSPDWLSMILFEPSFTQRLVDIGYTDAKARRDDFERLFEE